ncbi:MAG: helix-turn-helix domain-containing protein [Oscillospiraceae bacterium]|nr:helix-turn-helix domain-containing protein [Oscillospiraceae bacterium]
MEYDIQLIGQRIKMARKAKRYTQDYVSARANIGEKFLSQIECGNAGISVQTLLSLCEILEVSPNYILLANPSKSTENSIGDLLQGLTPRQLQDVETILKIFVKNCK